MKNTLSIGLTGGIGSGKTLITKVFSHLNIPIYYSDDRAKEFYKKQEMINKLVSYFGDKIINNGEVDKKELSNIIFKSKSQLRLLVSIIHPLVKQDYENWKIKQDAPYVIMESAILFESNWQNMFKKIICVYTPKEVAIKRVMQRDNITREKIIDRMKNQLSDIEKRKMSDFIIMHDDNKMLIPQILSIHNQILLLSKNV